MPNNSLQDRKYIVVIKPADKDGAIVFWRQDLYVQDAIRQISNTDFNCPIHNDPTTHQQDIITATVTELISQKQLPYSDTNLIQGNPICNTFCLLPKIHRVDNPIRPIVLTINCPTELKGQYLNSIISPLITKLPTFIKDKSDAIRLFACYEFTDNYQNRYLFTIDICSPYTNIPAAEGLAALRYYLEYYTNENRQTIPTLLRLTESVLNLSSFRFDGKFHIKNGVAMGTNMGPCYACYLLDTSRRRSFGHTMVPTLLC